MSVEEKLRIGHRLALGSHRFDAAEIKEFAAKYDPQPFHLSEEAAAASVFGALCASGWHTAAMWMRHNVSSLEPQVEYSRAWGEPIEFGPAAGLKNLKWLRPVYVDDVIRFYRTAQRHRPLASRPGWHMVTSLCEAENEAGLTVMSFEANVLIKA